MLHISTQKLIEKLLERTQNGTIDWKERVPDGVILETEGYVVELIRDPLNVRLSQTNGRVLEDVSREDLEATKNADGRDFADIVIELTREADRFARGTEQAIASILDAVESSTKPVLKSRPAFLGQPKEDTSKSAPILNPKPNAANTEPKLGSVSQTYNIDPYTSEGMSAAVGKMVAEINGDPAGDELDSLSTEEEIEQATSSVTAEAEQPTSAPVAEAPQDPSIELETTPADEDILDETRLDEVEPHVADELEVEDEIPEFKTHIVAPRPTLPVTPAVETIVVSEDLNAEENSPETSEEPTEFVEEISTPEDQEALPERPEMPDLSELETSLPENDIEPVQASIPDLASEDPILEAKEDTIAPPPPLSLDSELPELPDDSMLDNLPEDIEIPEIIPETKPETPAPVMDQGDVLEPVTPPPAASEPAPEKVATSAPLGFSFRNKVTATGFTIGGNIGTLISGVPDDIRQRADDHERMVRLQREKAEAEARAAKAKKAAEEATNARKSSIGFKSWS